MTAKQYLIDIRHRRKEMVRNSEILKVVRDDASRLDLAIRQAELLLKDSEDFWTIFHNIPAEDAVLLYTVYFRRIPVKTLAREAGKDPKNLYNKHRRAVRVLDEYLKDQDLMVT